MILLCVCFKQRAKFLLYTVIKWPRKCGWTCSLVSWTDPGTLDGHHDPPQPECQQGLCTTLLRLSLNDFLIDFYSLFICSFFILHDFFLHERIKKVFTTLIWISALLSDMIAHLVVVCFAVFVCCGIKGISLCSFQVPWWPDGKMLVLDVFCATFPPYLPLHLSFCCELNAFAVRLSVPALSSRIKEASAFFPSEQRTSCLPSGQSGPATVFPECSTNRDIIVADALSIWVNLWSSGTSTHPLLFLPPIFCLFWQRKRGREKERKKRARDSSNITVR